MPTYRRFSVFSSTAAKRGALNTVGLQRLSTTDNSIARRRFAAKFAFIVPAKALCAGNNACDCVLIIFLQIPNRLRHRQQFGRAIFFAPFANDFVSPVRRQHRFLFLSRRTEPLCDYNRIVATWIRSSRECCSNRRYNRTFVIDRESDTNVFETFRGVFVSLTKIIVAPVSLSILVAFYARLARKGLI